MTLPGDSLNHVHIRSEREFDFALPDVPVSFCVRPCVCVCVCVCVCARECFQMQGDTLSPSSY